MSFACNKLKDRWKKLISLLLFACFLFDFTSLPLITKAEVVNAISKCNGQTCLTMLTDIAVSDDGSFFLVVDSTKNPYVRKITLSSTQVTGDTITPLNIDNSSEVSLKVGISKDGKKAFVFGVVDEKQSSSRVAFQIDQGTDCRCSSGNYFDEMLCVLGTLSCTTTNDQVCSCDNQNFLNSCIARANGVKKYTKGNCDSESNLSCSIDSQCPLETCPNGIIYKKFTCKNAKCTKNVFSAEPCFSATITSIINIIDLTNNTVKSIIPSLNERIQSVSAVSFLDIEGLKIVVSNNDNDNPKILVIDTVSGKVKENLTLPGVARSIEFSPNLNKAIVTFKDAFTQSIGILNGRTIQIVKFDTPTNIFFDIDEFLSMADFDLSGSKSVVSSLDGNHVLHFLNLKENKLTIRFLEKTLKGKTLSTISLDGTVVVSVGNNSDANGIVVYKLNSSSAKLSKLIEPKFITDGSSALDVLITPDNDKIVVLIEKDNTEKIKILSFSDLSELCEFTLSNVLSSGDSFIVNDPYGRYILVPDFKNSSVSLISDLKVGPVFRSIKPSNSKKSGGAQFTVDGFVDSELFTQNVQICFKDSRFCSTSVTISDDGRTITGVTPPLKSKKPVSLLINAQKENTTEENDLQCMIEAPLSSKYEKIFTFK